ncbi:hypothetical protein SKAU_G00050950 [Synaphobranchus kaupii]|uniref:Uncharacterized protein n=1 Tax=Synaphobranchus kaupii TaxID=118154 RepID=A0A9Q1G356_SYNKA|nr:hypothetical protein SKAU_G00050950 [Synaphobranchus kaupii]
MNTSWAQTYGETRHRPVLPGEIGSPLLTPLTLAGDSTATVFHLGSPRIQPEKDSACQPLSLRVRFLSHSLQRPCSFSPPRIPLFTPASTRSRLNCIAMEMRDDKMEANESRVGSVASAVGRLLVASVSCSLPGVAGQEL